MFIEDHPVDGKKKKKKPVSVSVFSEEQGQWKGPRFKVSNF